MSARGGMAGAASRESWQLLVTGPASGSWNMAVDEWLMESVREGGAPTLRFYQWSPACLSFGRNQPARDGFPPEPLDEIGISAVRRITGGRAVLHERELTYSVTAPARLLGSPRAAYLLINSILLRGLRALGIPAAVEQPGAAPAPIPSTTPCFAQTLPGELSLATGKLVGSAQVHLGGALLQHGSILLERGNGPRRLRSRGIGIDAGAAYVRDDACGAVPSPETLATTLADAWRGWSGELRFAGESALEADEITRLEARFLDPSWTWRR